MWFKISLRGIGVVTGIFLTLIINVFSIPLSLSMILVGNMKKISAAFLIKVLLFSVFLLILGCLYILNGSEVLSTILFLFSVLIVSSMRVTYSDISILMKVALFSVPFSLMISILIKFNLWFAGVRTSEALFLPRFTFMFFEPSHYAIFLALSIGIAIKTKLLTKYISILIIGLILTWSLSGVILLLLLLPMIYSIRQNLHKYFMIFLSLLVFMGLYILFRDEKSIFIVNKINDLILVLNGEKQKGSAFVRFESIKLGYYFMMTSIENQDYTSILFGLGIGNLNDWVESYYSENYNIEMTESFNFLTNLVLSSGLVGFITSMIAYRMSHLMKNIESVYLMIVLSMFMGYAYGFLYVLYIYMLTVFNDNKTTMKYSKTKVYI
ncbi:hypothetical protein [Vibrio breoganii]|uniref:hypothetical protein n=1 Tax=Vibrio breoganii TaxID=553239 RepID=UPI000C83F0E8|nr:hypothetical protein [Vibrio breoganii]PMO34032.1 hypothetical protein BCT12_01490 [Vibrio breoganii]